MAHGRWTWIVHRKGGLSGAQNQSSVVGLAGLSCGLGQARLSCRDLPQFDWVQLPNHGSPEDVNQLLVLPHRYWELSNNWLRAVSQ